MFMLADVFRKPGGESSRIKGGETEKRLPTLSNVAAERGPAAEANQTGTATCNFVLQLGQL